MDLLCIHGPSLLYLSHTCKPAGSAIIKHCFSFLHQEYEGSHIQTATLLLASNCREDRCDSEREFFGPMCVDACAFNCMLPALSQEAQFTRMWPLQLEWVVMAHYYEHLTSQIYHNKPTSSPRSLIPQHPDSLSRVAIDSVAGLFQYIYIKPRHLWSWHSGCTLHNTLLI